MADNIARVFADAIATDPTRPLLTFYDDATGERTELSGATLANWVAKTANLLVDGSAWRRATPPACCCRRTGRPPRSCSAAGRPGWR